VSAMGFANDGYTTVVDGYLFPDGVAGLAAACGQRGLSCHYAVVSADLDTCWRRAAARGEGRWPLEFDPFARVHARFNQLDLDVRHVIDATGSADTVSEALLAAYKAGKLALTGHATEQRR
jgi:threonine dehydrogenase-like Zn-dependent dehydrogenase